MLLRSLSDSDANVRRDAAALLAAHNEEQVINKLIAALDDQPWVAEQVVVTLGKLKSERAVEPLVALIPKWVNKWIGGMSMCKALIWALSEIPGAPLEKVLLDIYKSEIQESADWAAQQLQGRPHLSTETLLELSKSTQKATAERALAELDARGWRPTQRTDRVQYLVDRGLWREAVSEGAAIAPTIAGAFELDKWGRLKELPAAVDLLLTVPDQTIRLQAIRGAMKLAPYSYSHRFRDDPDENMVQAIMRRVDYADVSAYAQTLVDAPRVGDHNWSEEQQLISGLVHELSVNTSRARDMLHVWVDVMLHVVRNEGYGYRVNESLWTLELMVKEAVKAIPSPALRSIASLPEIKTQRTISSNDAGDDLYEMVKTDCSDLRKRASQELSARGLR